MTPTTPRCVDSASPRGSLLRDSRQDFSHAAPLEASTRQPVPSWSVAQLRPMLPVVLCAALQARSPFKGVRFLGFGRDFRESPGLGWLFFLAPEGRKSRSQKQAVGSRHKL